MRWWPSRLYGRLLLSYLAACVLTLLVASLALTYFYQSYLISSEQQELLRDGRNIARLVQVSLLSGSSPESLSSMLEVVGPFVPSQPIVINRVGVVLAATPAGKDLVGVRLTRDAVEQVLRGRTVMGWGQSFGLSTPSIAVAVPVTVGRETLGAVILHRPLVDIQATVRDARRRLIWALAIALAISAALAAAFSRSVGRPLERMAQAAGRLAQGDLDERVVVEGPDELQQLARAFNHAAEAIGRTFEEQRRLERLRREFVANVSHEFRAPLASLAGFIELLEDGTIPPDQAARYLELMRQDTERLSRLVADLLDLSRLDAGKVTIRPEFISAVDAARRAVLGVEPRATSLGVTVEVAAEGSPTVYADPERLQQILTNLLDNAVDHTDDGGRVELRVRGDADWVRFEVIDTGEGIPEEELDLIWERFHRVDRSRVRSKRQRGGTGLGLSIVRQLVELHGGQVGVESRLGEGSRFWFTLPSSPASLPASV